MVLLSGPKAGIDSIPSGAVRTAATASGVVALLWWFRTWLLHVLDVALAWARGLPAERQKNAYLQGAAPRLQQLPLPPSGPNAQ